MATYDRTFLSPAINIEREGEQIILSLTTDYDADTDLVATLSFTPNQALDAARRIVAILEEWDETDVQRPNSQVSQ